MLVCKVILNGLNMLLTPVTKEGCATVDKEGDAMDDVFGKAEVWRFLG